MGVFKEYIIPRLVTYILVIFFGITITFIIPRLTPIDPVVAVISRISAFEEQYDPIALSQLMESLTLLFGLKGTISEQYIGFIGRTFSGDFGPSFTYFPTPVTTIIFKALPWTIGLLFMSTILSWLLGNLIGGIAGHFSQRNWAKSLGLFATITYPIPYYIMSLILIMLFVYAIPIFPVYGGLSMGISPSFSFEFIFDYLYHAALPALSLILVGYGWWFLSMRSIVVHTKLEDYVQFGEAMGLSQRKLMLKYVMRNSLLPQVTGLAMSLGHIFSGAMITETVFSYPGIGYILYGSIMNGDFNMMMAIVTYSIIGVATAALVLDLAYPLIDPRIRYK